MSETEKKLSIIIPCYNCSKTLREAVESCYVQGFAENEFEIVMVDDGSADDTWALMNEISTEFSNIKILKHHTNRGGGATRNTATENASAETIFCLDSDDLMTPNMLRAMVEMQIKHNADGIAIEKSIKFRGTDINDIAFVNVFGYRNELIPLDSLLQYNDIMCPLYSTFLYTKSAFNKIGGYPTDHGFDTQGFAWRFLSAGLKAYTCPDTVYLHRIDFHESYYLYEYNAGRTNINWKKILLEQNAVLSDEAYAFVIQFNELDFETDIISELKKMSPIFTKEKKNRNVDLVNLVTQESISRKSLRGIFFRIRSRLKRNFIKTRLSLITYISLIKMNVHSNESYYALFTLHFLRLKKILRIDFKTSDNCAKKAVDLFLPTVAKDFATLELVIAGARKHLQHKIGKIYIVSQPGKEIEDFCDANDCIFIHEDSVLGYGKDKIDYSVDGLDRSGWLFQQLLKFGGDKIVQSENFISIDSDTIMIKPHCFLKNEKFVFRQNEEWNESYFISFKNLFGYTAKTWFSYTSHMMIFNKQMLKLLKEELEAKHSKKWDQVYISTTETNKISCVSDYDTYANWVRCNHPNKVKNKVLYNKTFSRAHLAPLSELESKYSLKYHSVSFHSYASGKESST